MKRKFKSLAGQLLLDTGKQGNTFFYHTAVYMCIHDQEGALGFVINAPARVSMAEILPKEKLSPTVFEMCRSLMVGLGGPVGSQSLMSLFLAKDQKPPCREVVKGVYMVSSPEELVCANPQPKFQDMLFFMGYAGWDPGQLEEEIAQGYWITTKIDPKEIFGENIKNDIWKRELKKQGGIYPIIAQTPKKLTDN